MNTLLKEQSFVVMPGEKIIVRCIPQFLETKEIEQAIKRISPNHTISVARKGIKKEELEIFNASIELMNKIEKGLIGLIVSGMPISCGMTLKFEDEARFRIDHIEYEFWEALDVKVMRVFLC